MKACKFCALGDGYCDERGFCVYCNLGSALGRYPVRKNPDDCCDDFEPDENEA
jgi:hypothetical protein